MRLASAVGVFAVGLPPTTSLWSAQEVRSKSMTAFPEQEYPVQKILTYDDSYDASSLTNKPIATGIFKKGPRKKRQRIVNHRQKECDPWSLEADLGILSCGYNEYCEVNEDSDLGGRCVDTWSLDHRAVQESSSGNIIEYYQNICDSKPTCTCTNMNETENSGMISCVVDTEVCTEYPNICDTAVEMCSTYKSDLTFQGVGAFDYQLCSEITQPNTFNMCVYASFANFTGVECAFKLNDVECTSCEMVPTPTEICFEDGHCYNNTFFCYSFDCTNVEGGWAGNDCFPFYQYGCDVDDCKICSNEEELTLSNATFKIDKDSPLANVTSVMIEARCGDTFWLDGLSTEKCGEIQSIASEVCGCTTGETTSSPSSGVTTPAEVSPTGDSSAETQAPSSNSTSPTETTPSNPSSGSSQHLSSLRVIMITGFLMFLLGSAGGLRGW